MPVANTVNDYRVGPQALDRLYAGSNLIWPSVPVWPPGLIVHYTGDTDAGVPVLVAPAGWAICDGVTAHGSAALRAVLVAGGASNPDVTPNLIDMFVRTTSGGADSIALASGNLPAHAHSMGNDSATHTHVGTSGAMSANSTHSHTATLDDNSATHYHNIPTSNTGTVSAWHEHTSLIFNEGDGGDGDGTWVDQSPTNDGSVKDIGDSANPSANHQHYLPASTTSLISVGHTHGATTPAADPAHGHSFSVSGTGTHTHVINSEGDGAAISLIPDHYALIYIIKL
jgi:hypothetical protein